MTNKYTISKNPNNKMINCNEHNKMRSAPKKICNPISDIAKILKNGNILGNKNVKWILNRQNKQKGELN